MNYEEALQYISSVNWKGSVPGLERIRELTEKLGNPQEKLKFVHIGGTNGKGSTAAFVSSVLRAAGYKVGLFISPYIEVFNERMQINNQYISNQELADITEYVKPYAESMEDAPTEFELNTAIALVYFLQNQCDIVVFEVGMGGEFDATNIIPSPEAAVITAIGLDHTAYLGDTVEKIAQTKSGIIKQGSITVMYQQSEEITSVIRKRCEEVGSKLLISEPEKLKLVCGDIDHQIFEHEKYGALTIFMPAVYQKYNLALAIRTIEALRMKKWKITEEQLRKGLQDAFWPGRFEVLSKNPVFLVDGAHNPHGIIAAAESLKAVFPGKKLLMIFGVLADKDYELMLDVITPLAKKVFCVSPDNSRALSQENLSKEVRRRNVEADAFADIADAIDAAFSAAEEDDVICALGSLYMIGDIKVYYHQKYAQRNQNQKEIR